MTNKHAYFILAYNNPSQLKTLISLLDDERNDIYVHIDRDSVNFPMGIFRNLTYKSKLIIAPRISIKWAEYSQVDLQFRMLKLAKKENYRYYHFMTGMDMPLKSQDEIHEFFDQSDREFMGIVPKESEYQRRHVRYMYPLLKLKCYHSVKAVRVLSECGVTLQKYIGIDRTKKRNTENWTLVDGWDWFSITNDFAEYVLKQEDVVKRLFQYAKCPSEMAFQTVLFNSPFRDKLFDMSDLQKAAARLIDWKRGRPYVFRSTDFNELINSPFMFARKFDENIDSRIIEMLAAHIRKKG